MRVLVLHNQPVLPPDHPDAESEHEILDTARVVCDHLRGAGFEAVALGVGRDPSALLAGVRREKPDVVFNLFEGLADHYGTEAHVAGLLDWLGIPCTGCPYLTLCVARDKAAT